MWNGQPPHLHPTDPDESRRMTIEMALAHHVGSEYRHHHPHHPHQYAGYHPPAAPGVVPPAGLPQHPSSFLQSVAAAAAAPSWTAGTLAAAAAAGIPADNPYYRHTSTLEHLAATAAAGVVANHHSQENGHPREEDDEEDDDDEEEEEEENEENDDGKGDDNSEAANSGDDEDSVAAPPATAAASIPLARGKPEAMTAKLASAARLQAKMDELDAEMEEAEVVAEPLGEEDPMDATMDTIATVDTTATVATTTSQAAPPNGNSAPSSAKKKKKKATPKKSAASDPVLDLVHPTMDDPVQPITEAEYYNLDQMMEQFCRVPLLAEFSRPVALLHPELMSAYSKIVEHPLDLGTVCRKIRKRKYQNLRDVRLDIWRIFSNCVKYHSHPSNKEAVPSFVSIALHLRNYFNDIWQEHLLPSDPPKMPTTTGKNNNSKSKSTMTTSPEELRREAFEKRKEDRQKRLIVSGLSVMTGKSLARAADTLGELLENGGCVDRLDTEKIFGEDLDEEDDDADLDIVVENLHQLKARLLELSSSGADYGIDELERDVRKCYTQDVLESNPALRVRIGHRMDRWIGKIVVPIHEATCRGVSQSSIWGCMAAAVWARESSKKPYWPALVLGIMAPDHQREDWHRELTRRNESRLPDKLKLQLASGKRKAEASLKKHSQGQMEPQSFFLVEFLGTHEFIWVREADIVEDFDANEDPNQPSAGSSSSSKKKRASRSNIANIIGSKMYASAVEEAQWALEEFELQLQDVGSDGPEDDDEGYSYPVLCQSDDEADQVNAEASKSIDVDDLNELLATEGLIDFSTAGRKNAKKRAQAIKKQKADAEKKLKADKAKKLKAEQSKKNKNSKTKDGKKDAKEPEKKTKKRVRETEKTLKVTGPQFKRRKIEPEEVKKAPPGRRNLINGKRERAMAIVEGYLYRAMQRNHYKSLSLGGVLTIPASLIDSTGLLGMAMAFRAASGELPMPDESGSQEPKLKPWDAIKVDSKKKSAERIELLEKQAALLEKEISRLREAAATRKKLTAEVLNGYGDVDTTILEEDTKARENPLKKAAKAVSSPDPATKTKGAVLSAEVEPQTPGDEGSYADTEGDSRADPVDDTQNGPSGDGQDAETTASGEVDELAQAESSADEATNEDGNNSVAAEG